MVNLEVRIHFTARCTPVVQPVVQPVVRLAVKCKHRVRFPVRPTMVKVNITGRATARIAVAQTFVFLHLRFHAPQNLRVLVLVKAQWIGTWEPREVPILVE